jgi:methylmalonyl-CoA/ethylmalonyl-CoA epimerase
MRETSTIQVSRLGHIAIAVPSLELALKFYLETFECEVSDPVDIPKQNIRIAYVKFSNINIELMQPISSDSAITKFLDRNSLGGIHHFCLSTPDVVTATKTAKLKNIRVIGEGVSHDNKGLFFLHPKDAHGSLIEIEED